MGNKVSINEAVSMLQGFYASTGGTKIARHVDVMRTIRLIGDMGDKYCIARTIACAKVLGELVDEAGDVEVFEKYGFVF